MRRKRVSKRFSKQIFSRTARKVHKKNLFNHISRGGTQLWQI